MSKPRIIEGICSGYNNSNVSKVGKSVTCNFVPESQGQGASTKMILRSISGTKLYLEMPESNCRGMYRVSRGFTGSSMLYVVYGAHLYLIYEDNGHPVAYQIGGVSNGISEPVSMCETNGYGDAHPHLVIADGVQVFAVDTTLQPGDQVNDYRAIALPVRNDGQTYIKPSHVAYLFGYLVCLDQGTDSFFRSYRYPFEELDPTTNQIDYDIFMTNSTDGRGNEMPCEWSADSSIALTKAGSFIYVFGERSYQFFHFTSDEHYPFQCPDTAAGDIGILAPRSIATIGTSVYWLGASDIGENGVWMIDKSTVTRISTVDIEHEISALTNRGDAVAQAWHEGGHIYYALTFRQDARTFVYDTAERLWHTRASYDPSRPNCEGVWRPQYATLAYNNLYFGDMHSNALVVQDNNRWKEWDDTPIVRRRATGIITDSFAPFYCDEVKLYANVGQFSLNESYGVGVHAPDPELEPSVAMRYSWDGGMTWSDQEIAYAGPLGRYDWQLEWYGLGMGELLSIEIVTSDPWPMAIIGAKISGEATSLM
jgi:hypothetical protein